MSKGLLSVSASSDSISYRGVSFSSGELRIKQQCLAKPQRFEVHRYSHDALNQPVWPNIPSGLWELSKHFALWRPRSPLLIFLSWEVIEELKYRMHVFRLRRKITNKAGILTGVIMMFGCKNVLWRYSMITVFIFMVLLSWCVNAWDKICSESPLKDWDDIFGLQWGSRTLLRHCCLVLRPVW